MLSIVNCLMIIILSKSTGSESLELTNDDDGEDSKKSLIGFDFNSTNCTDYDCQSEEDYIDGIVSEIAPDGCRWILIVMHSIVFVVGIVGNVLICLAVYRNPTMRTVINYFIVNLAVADFLVILFCLPSTVIWDVTQTWFFGSHLCKAIPYLQTVSVSVSIMTLTFISTDRWYAICFPLRFKSTTSRAKKAIVFIWIVSFIFDIPDLLVLEVVPADHLRIQTIYYTQCTKSWSPETERTFTFIKLALLYFGPLGFMTIAYWQIIRVLWRNDVPGDLLSARACRFNGKYFPRHGYPECQLRARRKAAKMLITVVAMFAICYFPVHLLSILRQTVRLPSNELTVACSLLAHWLCYANSALNPFIYNFMSGKFRKEFRHTFCHPDGTDNLNTGRVTYKFASMSNLSGQRSNPITRSVNVMSKDVAQLGLEMIPLSAISNDGQNDKLNRHECDDGVKQRTCTHE